jgi:hypothetical protein
MVNEEQAPLLGKHHRRALGSRLLVLDQALCDFERWAQGYEVESALYAERNNLTTTQRKRIQAEVTQLRQRLFQLRDALQLEPHLQKTREGIISRGALLWELLIELEPKYLKRYGELPPGLGDYLEPRVVDLQRHLENIARIAAGEGLPARRRTVK